MEVTPVTDRDSSADPGAPEYQSLSGAAVMALVLGLASPLALALPVLLVIPAAAVCLAILAQRKIRDSAGTQTGAAVARWGVALALISATAALAHGPVRDAIYRRQLTEIAQRWFNLLAEDRIDDALALLSGQATSNLRPPSRGPGETPPPEAEVLTIVREKMRTDPIARCLSGKKTPLVVTVLSATESAIDGGRTMLSAEFTVAGAGDENSCRIMVQGVRLAHYVVNGQPWRIERWGETAAAPHDHAHP